MLLLRRKDNNARTPAKTAAARPITSAVAAATVAITRFYIF